MAVTMTVVGLLGGLALTLGPLERWIGHHLITIVHEGGHAVAAVLCTGRVNRIELHTRKRAARTGYQGVTHFQAYRRRWAWIAAAGYPAPAALGLAVLALLYHQHGKGALAALIAALAVMLLLIRNIFGAFLLLSLGAVLYLVFLNGPPALQTAAVGVFAWTLLLGGTRSALDVLRNGGEHGDAADLEAMTGARAELWAMLFVLLTAAPTGYAAWLTANFWF